MHAYVVLYEVYEVFTTMLFTKLIFVYIHLYSTNSPILLLFL